MSNERREGDRAPHGWALACFLVVSRLPARSSSPTATGGDPMTLREFFEFVDAMKDIYADCLDANVLIDGVSEIGYAGAYPIGPTPILAPVGRRKCQIVLWTTSVVAVQGAGEAE